jgi:hypothetical protein
MGASIEGPGKRRGLTISHKAGLLSDHGSSNPFLARPKPPPAAYKKISLLAQMKRQKAADQILEFYSPGWKGLSKEESRTRNSLSQALLRNGAVTALKDQTLLVHILQSLERAGKIRLPPKSKTGGARNMKVALARKK